VRLDFQLIPNIQPEVAARKLKAHLKKHGFDSIEVKTFDHAEPPYKIEASEDIAQAIIAAAHEVYGEPPIVNGVSAEGAILKHVWIPCVLTGFANPGCNLHAPDENIHIDKYIKGIKAFVKDIRTELPDESELQNIVDEIADLIDSTLYKLKTFK
jgi:acetylornithine deacetylase/succinyl-diaminopimelate desuccinylase-like protein